MVNCERCSTQRRVKDRRGVRAKKLVYAASNEPSLQRSDKGEPGLVGAGIRGWNFGNILR